MVFIHTKMYTDEVFNDKHHSLDFSQIYTNIKQSHKGNQICSDAQIKRRNI